MDTIETKKRTFKGSRLGCCQCKRRKVGELSNLANSNPVNGLPSDRVDQSTICSLHIGERLCKLEQLFERFVCRKNPVPTSPAEVLSSPTLVGSSDKESTFGASKIASDARSMSSIGEGILGAQTWTSAPVIRNVANQQNNEQHCDAIQQSLVALLPSQHDADIIFESSNGWMILDGIYKAGRDLFVNQDPQSYALSMTAIARERSIIVARTLLHLAICINTLPPEFEQSRLSNMWSLDATMQNYVTTVTTLITSSDELMLTLHGLETLLLLGIYHMNSANLRQSWLIIRRGLNLAHLMGFHRIISQPDSNLPIAAMSSAKMIWRRFVDLDRYLGLHLRLPFAADDYDVPEDADFHLTHRSKLNVLTRQIAELDREISPQAYASALALDEKLESTMREIPKDFWEVPNIPSTARSPESFSTLERLMVQLWHFELKVFIHLPYLLRASRDSRYEFSKVTGLQASRSIVMRWFALRNAGITQACFRFAEIGVFIAAVTLTLDIVIELGTKEKSEVQKSKGTDFAMICRLIGEMEKLAKTNTRERIAGRSAIVLKKILSSLDPSRQSAGKTRLKIPYFGTIELDYKKLPVRPNFDVDSETGKKMQTGGTRQNVPVFSFVNNALWPSLEEGHEQYLDWDVVLFDGLEDRDTEGNWVF
ncbi:hypothetical protein GQ44DRAFT_699863 [Phaeosphaeriaceae sp. PMI808]|nr:hypothetical protein GQ44DRAFT_699863 [Phaeosphaeriaceae sp. PMI808]